MKTIIQISDLHFGTEDTHIADLLIQDINRKQHDVLLISGDLTQRALSSQFQAANAFLKRLKSLKIISVPGNHDVPLYNPFTRLFNPYKNYRKYINPSLNSLYQDDELLILGINTSTKKLLIRGHINHSQMQLVRQTFKNCNPKLTKILFFHHNLIKDEYFYKKMITNYEQVVELINECEIDLVLTGHLHIPHIRKMSATNNIRDIYEITAGTGVSKRIRKVNNSYNLIEIDKDSARITFLTFDGEKFSAGEQFQLNIGRHD